MTGRGPDVQGPANPVVSDGLARRARRPADAAAEARALRTLSRLLVTRPAAVPRRVVEAVLSLCPSAGSAGVSELRRNAHGDLVLASTFVAGPLADRIVGEAPPELDPFGGCLQRRRAILLEHPGRVYPVLDDEPPAVEALAAPLLARGRRALGVLWAVSHDADRLFTSRDADILERLATQLVLALTLRDAGQARPGREGRSLLSGKDAGEARRLGAIFDQAPGFIAVLRGPEHEFIFANKAYRRMVGQPHLTGRKFREVVPELAEQGFVGLLDAAFGSGAAIVGEGVRVKLRGEAGGARTHYVDFVYQPVKERSGAVSGIFIEGQDVSDRVLRQEAAQLLSQEACHRVKNTLATVQAMAAHTARTSADLAAFLPAFKARLSSLARTTDILVQHAWEGAPLGDVLEQELGPFREKAQTQGPRVMLSARQAGALGMIVHELVTNSSKYGAFSAPEGRVSVDWALTAQPSGFVLRWIETQGPAIEPPQDTGFGTTLIRRLAAHDLAGTAVIDFAPGGIVCEITARLRQD